MKKLIFFYLLSSLFAVDVTFQVDMQDEESTESVYFVNWTTFSFDLMDPIEESNIYIISYDLSSGESINYRFATDNTFNPGTIEEDTRTFSVPSEDTMLDVICYNSELACPEDLFFPVTITFIDGSENWDNIWFQGSFDNWTESYAGIVDNNIWTLEFELLQGEYGWGAFQALNDEGDQDIWLTPNFPNPVFTVDADGVISGETFYELIAYPVEFQINDGTASLDSIYIKLGSTDFSYPNWEVNNYCDDSDSDNTWICSIFLQPSELVYWKAFEVNGTDLNSLINEDNLEFSLSEEGIYDAELTTLSIPDVGEWITNSVRFEVDMTEWLDEEGLSGIPIFSVARNDEVQVRGDWNGWGDGDASNSIMIRQPGTNIFSLPVEISYFSGAQYQYKFYIKHSEESIDTLEARFGAMDSLMNLSNWGWENAPLYGGGNRRFTLSESESIVTVREGYYDLPPGGVIPFGTDLTLSYSVDLSNENLFDGDSVRIILKDKWTNYIQGFENTSVNDDNLESRFDANCSSDLCTFAIEQQGPFGYYTLYNWEYKNSDGNWVTEGGEYGTYGKYRARYITPTEDFEWVDFNFPQDTFQENPPYEPEQPPIICSGQVNGCGECETLEDLNCIQGCDGNWSSDGNEITFDNCGICGGDNTTCLDCAGVVNGNSEIDECGNCDDNYLNDCIQDCTGVWGGISEYDLCISTENPLGICGGGDISCTDCNGDVNGLAVIDGCDNCIGGNTGEEACSFDCLGIDGGSAYYDECGSCVETLDIDCIEGCDGIWKNDSSVSILDDCNICNGNNASCSDCAGVPNGNSILDNCGVCDENTSNDCTQDCLGAWGGIAEIDECEICDIDPSNGCVEDCNGEWGGPSIEDECGICDGSGPEENFDCNGSCQVEFDECGICGGDNSTCTGCMDNTACNYDESASINGNCEYTGEDVDCEGNPLSIEESIPKEFEISSAYPNPFNPICQFSIANPKFSQIEISIYNIQGKLASDIYSGNLSPGFHNFHWNAQNFQSGLYFIKVNYDNTNEVMRVTLIK